MTNQQPVTVPEMWQDTTVVYPDKVDKAGGTRVNRVEYQKAPRQQRQPAAQTQVPPAQTPPAAAPAPSVPPVPAVAPPVATQTEQVQQQTPPAETPPAPTQQASETSPDLAALDSAFQRQFGVSLNQFVQNSMTLVDERAEQRGARELANVMNVSLPEAQRRLGILAQYRNQVAQTDPMRAQSMGTPEGAAGAWQFFVPDSMKGTPIADTAPRFDYGGAPIVPQQQTAQYTWDDVLNPSDPAVRQANWTNILQAAATGQIK